MEPGIDLSDLTAAYWKERRDRVQHGPHTSNYVYKCSEHSSTALSQMDEMRKNGDLCNVELHTKGGKVLQAHRLVLAACSPYFQAMFRTDLIERRSGIVHLDAEDTDVIEHLVDFCYTSKIDITAENVQRILPTADLLQMDQVKMACCDYMSYHLDSSNCLGVWMFAERHLCDKLALKASIYARERFLDVARRDEFVELPLDRLQWLTKHPELNIGCEVQVCEAVLRWVGHRAKKRSCHLLHLLQDIRLQLMHPNYVMSVLYQHPLVRNDGPSTSYLRDYVLGGTSNGKDPSLSLAWRPRDHNVKERVFPGLDDIIVMGGGDVFEQHATGERYSSQEDCWATVTGMLTKRVRLSVASVKGCLYALGGHDGTFCLRSVEILDPLDGHWQSAPMMNSARDSAAVAVHEDKLYMIGGHNGVNRMDTMEVYDPDEKEWADLTSMSVALTSAAAATLGEYIYVCGGNDGFNFVNKVQRYHVQNAQWFEVQSMSIPRNRLGVVSHLGSLYVTGGLDTMGEWLATCEKYDPEKDKWTPFKKMNVARCRHCMAVADGYMYAVGGFGGSETVHLNSVERYDHTTDEWHQMASLITRRGGAGCGVMTKGRPKCPHKSHGVKKFIRRESQC